MFIWEKLDKSGERIITEFSLDVFKLLSGYMPSGMLPSSARDKLLEVSRLYLCPVLVATNFPYILYSLDPDWSIRDDMEANVLNGYLSTKVICLFESLLERRLI